MSTHDSHLPTPEPPAKTPRERSLEVLRAGATLVLITIAVIVLAPLVAVGILQLIAQLWPQTPWDIAMAVALWLALMALWFAAREVRWLVRTIRTVRTRVRTRADAS